MTAQGRADAIYQGIKASNPNMAKLNNAEDAAMRATLKALWGQADLGYITATAQINPGSLQSQAGQPVSTAGSALTQQGTVTANTPIAGLGTLS